MNELVDDCLWAANDRKMAETTAVMEKAEEGRSRDLSQTYIAWIT
jgi:hypothetical protein